MKTIFNLFALTLALLLVQKRAYSQSQSSDERFEYQTNSSLIVRTFNITTQTVDNTVANDKVVNEGIRFKVIGDRRNDATYGNFYLIEFIPITSADPAGWAANVSIIKQSNTRVNNQNFYCITEAAFNDATKVTKWYPTIVNKAGWKNIKPSIGQLSVPFKIRPKLGTRASDFTSDFTIGASFGGGIRLSHHQKNYLNVAAAFGVTSVNADSSNTNGYLKETTKWSALSGGLATTVDFNGFQIGAVVGFDFVGGEAGRNWVYNKNLWYSIGIGYQFIKPKD